ncbi:hypothetical protein Sviol_75770 [Streptomyces violascens]|uniref:Uncharacterized protein n=1 Tax=Streptomyces violascens TaxID=67381 RepID=A0ABQ3R0V7_9ACTN|nr:hypothetical protein Sviol_75770 [Streptomyces violascens]
MNISRRLKAGAVATAVAIALPVLGLATASPAAAGSCDFGGGGGDSCTSRFEPTWANCDGIFGYLRSHCGNIGAMNNTFQNEWRQCAAKYVPFGRG